MNVNLINSYFDKIDDILKQVNDLSCEKYKNNWLTILNNMKQIYDYAQDYFKDDFRYIDYFSYELEVEQLMAYFDENYQRKDKQLRKNEFVLFGFIKYLSEMFDLYNTSDFDFLDLCGLLDINNYYEKLLYLSNYLVNNLQYNETNELPFLKDNKYKIFFTGLTLEDIKKLDQNTMIQFIHKINNPLATETLVPRAEAIDHVKDAYGIPIQRVRFAADYRIAFMRVEDVTVILGVVLKTGKNIDYTRYDVVAKKHKELYEEIEKFRNGEELYIHTEVMNILNDAYSKKYETSKNL